MATVTIDHSSMVELELSLSTIKGGAKAAIRYATNDSISGVRTESVKLIGGKITAPATVIRKHFSMNKMSVADMSADITCLGDPLPLISYSARGVRKGVSVKVLKAGTRSIVRHAFIATMKSGHKGVFWRKSNVRGGTWKIGVRRTLPSFTTGSQLKKYQLPIHELYGPRIPDVFDDPEIIDPVMAHASKRFDDRLEYHTNRLLEKAR